MPFPVIKNASEVGGDSCAEGVGLDGGEVSVGVGGEGSVEEDVGVEPHPVMSSSKLASKIGFKRRLI